MPSYGLVEGVYTSAGYLISNASCERSLLNSSTNVSNVACYWKKLIPAGLVASFLSVKCILCVDHFAVDDRV
jgi:hypothetical protein